MFGNMGVILRIDLTKGSFTREDSAPYLKQYLGGRGLNHILLFRDTDVARIDAFDPENEIIFSSGPLGGTTWPSSGRCQATFIAPLAYSGWGDSNVGGSVGPEIKFAGYDAIVISGRSERPAYVTVQDESVDIKPADDLWGKGLTATSSILHRRYPGSQTLLIGPAGENRVRFANVRTHRTDMLGRCGAGAVMGSKNLKGLVIKGSTGVRIFDPDKFLKLSLQVQKELMDPNFGLIHGMTYKMLSAYGTPGITRLIGQTGMTPIQNWNQCGWWSEDGELTQDLIDRWGIKRDSCFGCPIHCHGSYRVDDARYPSVGGGPEYETTNALGHKCLEHRAKIVLKLNEMCNDLGLDTVESGNMFAALMEWHEKGIIDEKFTDGVSMGWGNGEGMMELLPKIATRSGCGDVLAEGPYRVGKKLGNEALKYVFHYKGMGATGVDTRATIGTMLQFAVSPRGAHHLTGIPTAEWVNVPALALHTGGFLEAGDIRSYHPEAKARLVKYYENLFELPDSMGTCKFPWGHTGFWHDSPEDLEKMWDYFCEGLLYATGIHYSKEELMEIGERAYQIERAVIVLRGITRNDDMPNWRSLHESCPGEHPVGPNPLPPIDKKKYSKVLDKYYELRGWTREGVPTRRRLQELGLGEIADRLEREGVLAASEERTAL
ncbi:MAG: aldehyde ferredoxin oxidoreductase family protein [Deltaproteobacteria bacterium]|nr:aldehyde ferredoxin oxidoreductase family protein [Deltaproteobacteria bacterium]